MSDDFKEVIHKMRKIEINTFMEYKANMEIGSASTYEGNI